LVQQMLHAFESSMELPMLSMFRRTRIATIVLPAVAVSAALLALQGCKSEATNAAAPPQAHARSAALGA